MPDIIKRGRFVRSEEVVVIPDKPEKQGASEAEVVEQPAEEDPSVALEMARREARKAREQAESIARLLIEEAGAERDSILRQAQDEADRVLKEAQNEGYNAGRKHAADDAADAIKQLKELIDELTRAQIEYFEHYERELKYLSIDVARKIMSDAIEIDEMVLADLIRHAVSSVKGADWITVELPQRAQRLVKLLSKEFAAHATKHIEVITKDTPIDSCIIKTPFGNIDASVSTQLVNLREIFEDMDSITL